MLNEIEDVVRAHRALAFAGQSDLVWGHASVRSVDGRGVWMKAAGWGFEEIDRSRVVLVNRDGAVVSGEGKRHLEYPIHTEVLAARSDVQAVVHTHSEAAVAFASLDQPLRALSHDAVPFLDPDVARFELTGHLISDEILGAALAQALGENNGVLIPGHGLVAVGADIASAVMHAVLLDRACRIQLQAIAAGGPHRWSSDAELSDKRRELWTPAQLAAGYDYLVRGSDR